MEQNYNVGAECVVLQFRQLYLIKNLKIDVTLCV